jgi:hypothetical protein
MPKHTDDDKPAADARDLASTLHAMAMNVPCPGTVIFDELHRHHTFAKRPTFSDEIMLAVRIGHKIARHDIAELLLTNTDIASLTAANARLAEENESIHAALFSLATYHHHATHSRVIGMLSCDHDTCVGARAALTPETKGQP